MRPKELSPMIKSVRNFALVAVLSLVAAPSLFAEPMGCNPRPPQGSNAIAAVAQAALALIGL